MTFKNALSLKRLSLATFLLVMLGAFVNTGRAIGPTSATSLALNFSNAGGNSTLTATLFPYVSGSNSTNGETITFFSNGVSVATGTLTNGVASATIPTPGSGVYAMATYPGDANFSSSTSNSVQPGGNAILATSTALTFANGGGNTTLTASVNPSSNGATSSNGDIVKFYRDGVFQSNSTMAGGSAQLVVPTPAAGVKYLAIYQGDSALAASSSNSVVPGGAPAQAATSLALFSNNNPSVSGSAVTFTAFLYPFFGQGFSTDGEIVTFFRNGTQIGTGTLANGAASFTTSTIPIGTAISNQIQASYPGDAHFFNSFSNFVGQLVTASGPAVNTSLALNVSSNPIARGATLTMTASLFPFNNAGGATTNGETVTFTSGGTPIATGTLNSGTATATTVFNTAGQFTLQASYPGDPSFNPSFSNGVFETVQ